MMANVWPPPVMRILGTQSSNSDSTAVPNVIMQPCTVQKGRSRPCETMKFEPKTRAVYAVETTWSESYASLFEPDEPGK